MSWLTSLLRRPPIGWWDLADILVVSFLIYEVLKLIRGTRAVQMALGGCVLVGLFYGSRWGHLETVNWLVRNMIGYMVFAAIVLFQSDIRRALAHFGRAPFFRYLAKGQSAEDAVEEAFLRIWQRRTGPRANSGFKALLMTTVHERAKDIRGGAALPHCAASRIAVR